MALQLEWIITSLLSLSYWWCCSARFWCGAATKFDLDNLGCFHVLISSTILLSAFFKKKPLFKKQKLDQQSLTMLGRLCAQTAVTLESRSTRKYSSEFTYSLSSSCDKAVEEGVGIILPGEVSRQIFLRPLST